MQIGAAKANEAVQMGNIGATEVAGKSALAAQTLTGLATYSPSVYTTPWYQQAWEEGQEAKAARLQEATAAYRSSLGPPPTAAQIGLGGPGFGQ